MPMQRLLLPPMLQDQNQDVKLPLPHQDQPRTCPESHCSALASEA